MGRLVQSYGRNSEVKEAQDHLQRPDSQCALEGPSSFLILNLAPPWAIVRLFDLASPPPVLLQAGVGVATCTPTCCFPPAGAMPPACSGSDAATRHQLSSFGPILLSYFLAQLVAQFIPSDTSVIIGWSLSAPSLEKCYF